MLNGLKLPPSGLVDSAVSLLRFGLILTISLIAYLPSGMNEGAFGTWFRLNSVFSSFLIWSTKLAFSWLCENRSTKLYVSLKLQFVVFSNQLLELVSTSVLF